MCTCIAMSFECHHGNHEEPAFKKLSAVVVCHILLFKKRASGAETDAAGPQFYPFAPHEKNDCESISLIVAAKVIACNAQAAALRVHLE